MGEPGTKELLTLAELEASSGVRTGRKHTLSILVENKPGVLPASPGCSRAAASTSTRSSVGPTDDERCRASR